MKTYIVVSAAGFVFTTEDLDLAYTVAALHSARVADKVQIRRHTGRGTSNLSARFSAGTRIVSDTIDADRTD
jgi:hypothetical protein